MRNKTEKEICVPREGEQSVAMTIIFKLHKKISFLLILNLLTLIGFAISTYDSVKIRDKQWDVHERRIQEMIENKCLGKLSE